VPRGLGPRKGASGGAPSREPRPVEGGGGRLGLGASGIRG